MQFSKVSCRHMKNILSQKIQENIVHNFFFCGTKLKMGNINRFFFLMSCADCTQYKDEDDEKFQCCLVKVHSREYQYSCSQFFFLISNFQNIQIFGFENIQQEKTNQIIKILNLQFFSKTFLVVYLTENSKQGFQVLPEPIIKYISQQQEYTLILKSSIQLLTFSESKLN